MTVVFSEEPRAPPARISIKLPYGKSPANSGAEIIAARGGDDPASIAQMYICALAGVNPCPQCRLRAGIIAAAAAAEKEHTVNEKHHLHIELTPEQYQLLSQQAKQCGLTKRAYLVRIIEGNPVRARPSQEIKDLRTEIHHIGNNINQIARSVNAGIASAEDAKRGLYLLDQVYELMYQIAKN
jgi:hypothetical protein